MLDRLNIIFIFNESLKVCLSVSFYLFVTLLVTVGTLHCLLSICIVVNQKLQQTVLWGEGVVSLQYRCVTAAKTDIKDFLHKRVVQTCNFSVVMLLHIRLCAQLTNTQI